MPARKTGAMRPSTDEQLAFDDVGAAVLDEVPTPDLEVRTILSVINTLDGFRDLRKYALKAGRRDLRLAAEMAGSREKVHAVADFSIDGPNGPIATRLYVPSSGVRPYPVLIWFHGGGFILGDLEVADGTCRAIANRSGAAVLSVDYRLAPEHPLMASRDDCIAATRWVHQHGAERGLDPQRLAVGGDSAGGNLAAVVAQHCANHGPQLTMQVLVYPATDLQTDYKDHPCAEGFMLSNEVMAWIRAQVPEDLARPDVRLSPAMAENLAGVAPALVITAGCDPLREDGLRYIERLREAGVPVASLHYPGQFHGFLTFDLILHGARDALDRIGMSLSEAFSEPKSSVRAVKTRQHRRVRRKLTELYFGQLMAGRFIFDANRAVVRKLAAALGLRPRDVNTLSDFTPRRFRRVTEDVS